MTQKQNNGFTLIELLVVIAVIGLLASIVLVAVNNTRKKARDAKKVSDMRQIQIAVEQYFDDNGYYPYTIDCSIAAESAWVRDNGTISYTPDGIVQSWSDLENQLAPYMSVPKAPNGVYAYGATPKDYKIMVGLEADDEKMINDGGCYPIIGTGCTTLSYEVFGGLKGTAKDWTCVAHMCIGF